VDRLVSPALDRHRILGILLAFAAAETVLVHGIDADRSDLVTMPYNLGLYVPHPTQLAKSRTHR
jgi:hypothetical protein